LSDERDFNALAVDGRDNVAVALADLAQGAQVRVAREGRIDEMVAADAVPLGHKLALAAIAQGAPVVKYGEVIGVATSEIAPGAHVHVHNVASRRGK
jgi:altronate dehydratase small subunit